MWVEVCEWQVPTRSGCPRQLCVAHSVSTGTHSGALEEHSILLTDELSFPPQCVS